MGQDDAFFFYHDRFSRTTEMTQSLPSGLAVCQERGKNQESEVLLCWGLRSRSIQDGLTHMSGALADWPKIPSQSPVGFELSLSYSAALPSCPTPPHPSSLLHPRRLTCKDSTSIGTDPRAPKSSGFQLALATGGLLGGRRFRPFLFLRPWTEGA